MPGNFVEELVSEYYQFRGYLVMTNYWFPVQTTRTRRQGGTWQEYSARSWSDIDVLAVGPYDVLVVQVKAIVNQARVADSANELFARAQAFLQDGQAPDGTSSIAWWRGDRVVREVLVHEYYSPPIYLDRLRQAGVEVFEFESFFDEIVGYAREKSGVKEESTLMRLIHFLDTKHYLRREDG